MKLNKPFASAVDLLEAKAHLRLGASGGGLRAASEVERALQARDCALRHANPSRPERIDRFIVSVIVAGMDELKEKRVLRVCKEGLANHLEVPEHLVAQSLERLNKLGLVGPERNVPPMDSSRSNMGSALASDSQWAPSYRFIREEGVIAYLRGPGLSEPRSPSLSRLQP